MNLKKNGQQVGTFVELLCLWLASLWLFFSVRQAWDQASHSAIGRDQGIFQYIAWATSKGQISYVDIRDVNGPITYWIHRLFLTLGGEDTLRFHLLDLGVTASIFFIFGFFFPNLKKTQTQKTPSHVSPHFLESQNPKGLSLFSHFIPIQPITNLFIHHQIVRRCSWGLLSCLCLMSQYLRYYYWDLAQRDSFALWFIFLAMTSFIIAESLPAGTRLHSLFLIFSGFLTGLSGFIKHTFFLIAFAFVFCLLFQTKPKAPYPQHRYVRGVDWKKTWARFYKFMGGFIFAVISVGLALAYQGSLRAFCTIYFFDVPRFYIYIWPNSFAEISAMPWVRPILVEASISFLVVALLLFTRCIRQTAVVVLFLCPMGLLSLFLQKKGFPYHLHPVSSGIYAAWLVALFSLSDLSWLHFQRWLVTPPWEKKKKRLFFRFTMSIIGFLLVSFGLSIYLQVQLKRSPNLSSSWAVTLGSTKDGRRSKDYLDHYRLHDFFPYEMHAAARVLKHYTADDDKIQTYGMDPYILFLSKRQTATPYIYVYDLDISAATFGARQLVSDQKKLIPILANIDELKKEHWADLYDKVLSDPPAAWVLFDKAPFMSHDHAKEALLEASPLASSFLDAYYIELKTDLDQNPFLDVHVWLRRDKIESRLTFAR